jgi:hypothetical protein
VLQELLHQDAALAEAVLSPTPLLLESILQSRAAQQSQRKFQQQRQIQQLNADPFDLNAQAKIQELIQQSNIEENRNTAIEYNPESFGRVMMLYGKASPDSCVSCMCVYVLCACGEFVCCAYRSCMPRSSVPTKVHGVEVCAFVDSGAQSSPPLHHACSSFEQETDLCVNCTHRHHHVLRVRQEVRADAAH